MRRKIFNGMLIMGLCTALMTAVGFVALRGKDPAGGELGLIILYLILVSFVLFVAVLLFSGYITRNIMEPLNKVGTDNTDIPVYEELIPVLRRMEQQKGRIRESASIIEGQESGLQTIIENMSEGLVLLDARGIIATINKSAAMALNLPAGDEYIGKHIFAAQRDPVLQAAVHSAMGGENCEELLHTQGRTLEIIANPVWADGQVRGVVVLTFDVTEKEAAEQMRREFSANVSHELKTPLTSISGYAEIIKDGVAKPEDYAVFAENIYAEAQHLIELIEDIIRISKLDEAHVEMSLEKVPLLEVSRDVAKRLQRKAEKYDVSIEVDGENADIVGNCQLMEEIIYNLCDNAIKYNVPGGKVFVTVEKGKSASILRVKDTGIGIPYEKQERVFERFYRADKSHSKQTAGTGLGLSIVKHGAAFHGGLVELESTPGGGTTVSIRFEGQSGKARA